MKRIFTISCVFLLFSLKVGAQTSESGVQPPKNHLTIAVGASGQWMRVPHGYNSNRVGITQEERNAVGWNIPVMVGFGLPNPQTQFMVGLEFGQTWASSAKHVVPNQFGPGTQTEIEKLRDGTSGFIFGPKLTLGNMSIGLYGHLGSFSTRMRRYIGANNDTPEIQYEDFTRLSTQYYGASFELSHRIVEMPKGRLDIFINTGLMVSSIESSLSASFSSRIGIIYIMQIR